MTPAGRTGRRVHVGGERESMKAALQAWSRRVSASEFTMADEMAARWWLKNERVEARLVP